MTTYRRYSGLKPEPLAHRQFASDNYSGICPEAWAALAQANRGHAIPYGDDPWCACASDQMRELFETDCDVFFVFNGTAANSLALSALCNSYHSVICHERGHIETDECGAPEFLTGGSKLLLAGGENGKIDPAAVEHLATQRTDIHYPKPRVLSITQATELGTVYSLQELHALREVAHKHDLRIHMDGARFANAVASLKASPKEVSWAAGVDVLSFGGGKNGMGPGEAVVFFRKDLAEEFDYRCKQAGQLASKLRLLAAPWIGMLQDDVWLKNARHANRLAARLAKGIAQIPGLEPNYPVQANSVFLDLPRAAANYLTEQGWRFYTFIGGAARFMCSWDMDEDDVDELLQALHRAVSLFTPDTPKDGGAVKSRRKTE